LIVFTIILVLAFTQAATGQQEELKMPFRLIRPSCFGRLYVAKAEFGSPELGKGCVARNWLEETYPDEKAKKERCKKSDKDDRIKLVGERSAANFSWNGLLIAGKEKEIKITVQAGKFIHCPPKNKPTITFLVFHDVPISWDGAIQEPNKLVATGRKSTEKTELPVEKKDDEWIAKTTLLLKESITKLALWEARSGGKDNSYIALHVRVFKQK